MNAILSRARSENGGVVVFLGFAMLFFVLLGAVGIDLGNWFVHKRHLQTQVDAAALAGGGLFGRCFVPGAPADTEIMNEATKYSGASGSLYNGQVGNANTGAITMLYQSKTYASGGPAADDTATTPPCTSLMLDVKGTETDLGTIFNFPGISTLATVRAHARVQLKKIIIFKGSLPLAVPEINPTHVTATFVNPAGAVVTYFELSGPTPSGNLKAWVGSGPVTVTSGQKLGVRIGLGQVAGVCGSANGSGGVGYTCFDFSQSTIGLASVAGYSSVGTPTVPVAGSFEVWPVTACSGSPFFSETSLTGGATTCSAGVQAKLHFASGTFLPANVQTFTATVNGVTKPLTESGGVWSTGYAFSIPVGSGPLDVDLKWKYSGGSNKSFDSVQRIYSASEDSGPVKVLTLTGTGGTGAPYALAAGSNTIGVNVALDGALHLSLPNETILLRLTGGSRTSAVACDGPGANQFRDAIINGCQTPYQLNPAGICPDPSPPSGPADCVPTKTGTVAGPTLQGLDQRFSTCPANNWPNYPLDDLRVIPLMITDFSALNGSGSTDVPVTNFGTFYVTGWTGSTCGNNSPAPSDVKKGAIWGHFIKYAVPDPNAVSAENCQLDTITPCVPVLTR